MNCILLSSSDHVLGKGFLIHVAGFHTSVVSPDFIFVSREKQNKRTLYTVATCKENIMHGGIWNAPINARVGISSLTCTSTCSEAALDESERMPKN